MFSVAPVLWEWQGAVGSDEKAQAISVKTKTFSCKGPYLYVAQFTTMPWSKRPVWQVTGFLTCAPWSPSFTPWERGPKVKFGKFLTKNVAQASWLCDFSEPFIGRWALKCPGEDGTGTAQTLRQVGATPPTTTGAGSWGHAGKGERCGSPGDSAYPREGCPAPDLQGDRARQSGLSTPRQERQRPWFMEATMSPPAPNLSLEAGSRGGPGPRAQSTRTSGTPALLLPGLSPTAPGMRSPCSGPGVHPEAEGTSELSLSLTEHLCFDLLLELALVKIKGHLHHQGKHFQPGPPLESAWSRGRQLKNKTYVWAGDQQRGARGSKTQGDQMSAHVDHCRQGAPEAVPLSCSSAPAQCPVVSTSSLNIWQSLEFTFAIQYYFLQGHVINADGNTAITK